MEAKAPAKRVAKSRFDQFGCIAFDPENGLEAAMREAEQHPVATEYEIHGDHITLHARAYVPPKSEQAAELAAA